MFSSFSCLQLLKMKYLITLATVYAICVILLTGVNAYSSSSSSCSQKRNEALKKQPSVIGMFIPECTASGDYSKVQCHGSTGFCWCANPKTGQQIGEQVRGRPNC